MSRGEVPRFRGSLLLLAALGAVVSAQAPAAPQAITPTAGMVITESIRLRPGRYRLPAPKDAAVVTIRGTGVTVDFTDVILEGGDPLADPDAYEGTAVLIDGGRNVTLRGATIRGYKVGILARRSPALHLSGNDLSYNWKPRLWSGIDKESLVDWMSFHDNEKDEWLRYGAAIYLSECDGAEVDNNRAVQGQNGLMVTRSSKLRVWNNTFSWMSGIGLGLYRTTGSTVQHNKLDWNVRGYSHGFYNRGQDSAALLMYEQSSGNTVAYNSATHGGDGLFLWAGQSTIDTGRGGSNDNLFYDNDFSHAVANGIEATFSRNTFVSNRVDDCWHGVWAGYSYDTGFVGNSFSGNTDAIAIEHGQNITIRSNSFRGDETAVRVWANVSQDPNWGYPKARDTRSRDYSIEGNRFDANKIAVNVTRTTGVQIRDNAYVSVGSPLQLGLDVASLEFERPGPPSAPPEKVAAPPMPGAVDAKLPTGAVRGRGTIIVDEWGPYDYRSPKIWPAGRPGDRPLKLRVLGPPGKWTLQSIRGATTTTRAGQTPGEFDVTPSGRGADIQIALVYVGAAVTTSRGGAVPAGKPLALDYAWFEPAIDWTVKFWRFEANSDPLQVPAAFAAHLLEAPLKTEVIQRLDYLTSRALSAGLPNDRVALRAEGVVDLPAGAHELSVISDDGVRVWIDDKLVVDRWSVHESIVDRVAVPGGRHRLKVEYFEATGWAELQVRFARKN